MNEPQEQPARDITLCMTCSQCEHEGDTPQCRKFRAWLEDVVESCGGPY
jgi:hypothetical protein